MKKPDRDLTHRKINQAIGSMAISGITVSQKTQNDMLRIAFGEIPAEEIKEQLITMYREKSNNLFRSDRQT